MKIDRGIAPLVKTMNRKGYRTVGSCQGHSKRVGWKRPFVGFFASKRKRRELGKKLKPMIKGKRVRIQKSPYHKTGYLLRFKPRTRRVMNKHISEANRLLLH